MIRSMTGYSRVRAEGDGFSLSLSVKSANHRFLDLQVRLPAALEPLDPLVRRCVRAYVGRGHVEVTVTLERASLSELQLDRKLLDAYVTAFQRLRSEFGFASEPDLVALLRIPGMVAAADGELSVQQLELIQQALERGLAETLERLNEMRVREGEVLGRDLRRRLERLEALCADIDKLALRAPEFYQRRLENRLREMLGSLGRPELDATRLSQEVAYLASRSDITEELTRLRSHLTQAKGLWGETSEVGKKLDFLLQEMNREANTLLAETTDVPEVGLEIARQAIEMKTEIERLREQAQNIE
jgi:uncharacterized protein (TIGR00255 family)